MENELIKINIPDVSIMASTQEKILPPGVASRLHYHDEIEFIVVYEGRICCTAYDREYEAGPGEIIFVNSRVPHSTYRKTDNLIGLIQFKENEFFQNGPAWALKYSTRIGTSLYTPVKVYQSEEMLLCAKELLRESNERRKGYGAFVRSSVFKLLGYLYRDGALADRERLYSMRKIKKVLPLVSYINENYAKEITLEEASSMLGFDPSYFCRVFKEATGATFTEYLNFVRVSKAEALIAEGGKSLLEISEASGFSSVSYFNRTFKKYKGCSPGVYRTARYSVE